MEGMDSIWTMEFMGMDMRQLALYIVTIFAVLMVITLIVKSR